jgi:hypothetical protein
MEDELNTADAIAASLSWCGRSKPFVEAPPAEPSRQAAGLFVELTGVLACAKTARSKPGRRCER